MCSFVTLRAIETDIALRFERGVDVALSLIRLFRAHEGCGVIAGEAAQQVQYAPDELVDECNGLVQWTGEKQSKAVCAVTWIRRLPAEPEFLAASHLRLPPVCLSEPPIDQ